MTTATEVDLFGGKAAQKMAGLYEMGAFGFVAIDVRKVDVRAISRLRPGQILGVMGDPSECIKFFTTEHEALGCIAGWISDGEEA